ncbi:MAG: DUF6484 domain-containing protein [Hyalangium sp.]|uniref:DUF6484 domain-containing protein n=1 Tax=Hyalangium sp. TaxID=2028555 RepID=UPI00389999DE
MRHALDLQSPLLGGSQGSRESVPSDTPRFEPADRPENGRITVGRIASIDAQGRVLVALHKGVPCPARLSTTVRRAEILEAAVAGTPVLLLLADDGRTPPILMGMVRDRLEAPGDMSVGALELQVGRERIALTAREELTLRCGEASITLRRDGKVIIKGEEIVSRARRTNKVKGATVRIN